MEPKHGSLGLSEIQGLQRHNPTTVSGDRAGIVQTTTSQILDQIRALGPNILEPSSQSFSILTNYSYYHNPIKLILNYHIS